MQVKLKQPLAIGKMYYGEMYVSPSLITTAYSNNLGLYLSEDPVIINEVFPDIGHLIAAKPQINDTTVIATDNKWYKVSGFFVADKAFEYLTVGNFFDDIHTKVTVFRNENVYSGGTRAYYYIDDIYVTETNITATVPNLGPDTTLCMGQSATLRVKNLPPTTYRWDDGSTALTRTVTKAGTYFVTATTGQYAVTDSIHITIEPPLHLPADTVLC